jgi:VWFA-related protein
MQCNQPQRRIVRAILGRLVEALVPRRLSMLLSVLVVSIPQIIVAQNDSSPNPIYQANAQAVIVDVVVTGGSDETVPNLSRQQFEVKEDGKTQTIDFFEEHTAQSAPLAPLPALPPNTYSNQPAVAQSDSVNVLLLDGLNTPEADQARIHKQILDFIAHKNPNTQIAIFALNTRLRLLQGFTADSSLLSAAVNGKPAATGTTVASRTRSDDLQDKFDVAMAGSAEAQKAQARSLADFAGNQDTRRVSVTLDALQQLVRALGAIQGRKNIIWFASSFPVSVFPDELSRKTMDDRREILATLHQTVDLMTTARVAIYPVSAQGIALDPTTDADAGLQSSGDDPAQSHAQNAALRNGNTAAMEQLAIDTGGHANYSTNDMTAALSRDIDNGARYYTLAYTPSNDKMDGRLRRIEVKIKEGKYKLAYRRGYFADHTSAPTAEPAADPLIPMMGHGLPDATQILYRVRVTPVPTQPAAGAVTAGGNHKLAGHITRYKVEFFIPSAGLNLIAASDGTHDAKIEVALVAYGAGGAAVNWTGGAMNMSLNPDSYATAQRTGIVAPIEIDLPDGDVSLATGVYDLNAQKAGTLEIPGASISVAGSPPAQGQPATN